jgi:hypothetical protein
MTIEATLERIAIALEALAKTPQSPFAPQPQPQVPAYTMPQAPAAPAPVPMPTAPVIPLPTAQAAPVPVPQYVPPQPATPAPMPGNGHAAPFSTPAEFTNYCMQKYRDLGPVKGPMLQTIINQLGHTSLNAVRPDQYAEFYAKVEAL